MRLFVRHRSDYVFSEPQARLVQLLRVTPGDHHGQHVVSWDVDVDRDARLRVGRDGYGNQTTMLYIDGPIERLTLDVRGEVLTEDRAGMVSGTVEPLPPLYFLQSTPATKLDEAIAAFAAGIAPGEEALPRAHALAEAIDERLKKVEPDVAADHDAAACFAANSADPQGAAHVLIAAARAIRLPARYVAGHLYRPDATEAHAAHGWAELHVEGYGWIAFDPHGGCCPTERYVRVATGLDHREAAPVSGLRTGGGVEALAIDVHVGTEPAPQD